MHEYIRIVYYVFLKGMCETISVLKGSDQDLIKRDFARLCLLVHYAWYIHLRAYVRTYGWMDGWMDGWVNGWMDGWMDGWMGEWVDGWMDG